MMTKDTPFKKHFAAALIESVGRLKDFIDNDAPDCVIEEEIGILMHRGLALFGTKIFENLVDHLTILAKFNQRLCVCCGIDPFPRDTTNPYTAWCPACSAKQDIWERKNLPNR